MITHASLKPELDCELVAFYGELDALAAPDLSAGVAQATAEPAAGLLIDLCGCVFIDTLGLAAIVQAVRTMTDTDRPIAIVCSGALLRRTLTLAGIDELVDVYWTRDEAVSALVGATR